LTQILGKFSSLCKASFFRARLQEYTTEIMLGKSAKKMDQQESQERKATWILGFFEFSSLNRVDFEPSLRGFESFSWSK